MVGWIRVDERKRKSTKSVTNNILFCDGILIFSPEIS